jgi:hypothetical protein
MYSANLPIFANAHDYSRKSGKAIISVHQRNVGRRDYI